MSESFIKNKYEAYPTKGDGRCMYWAIINGLLFKNYEKYKTITIQNFLKDILKYMENILERVREGISLNTILNNIVEVSNIESGDIDIPAEEINNYSSTDFNTSLNEVKKALENELNTTTIPIPIFIICSIYDCRIFVCDELQGITTKYGNGNDNCPTGFDIVIKTNRCHYTSYFRCDTDDCDVRKQNVDIYYNPL